MLVNRGSEARSVWAGREGAGGDGMPAMAVGGTRRLVVPAALAYGERGAGGIIPPGAAMEFKIELLSIK